MNDIRPPRMNPSLHASADSEKNVPACRPAKTSSTLPPPSCPVPPTWCDVLRWWGDPMPTNPTTFLPLRLTPSRFMALSLVACHL